MTRTNVWIVGTISRWRATPRRWQKMFGSFKHCLANAGCKKCVKGLHRAFNIVIKSGAITLDFQ